MENIPAGNGGQSGVQVPTGVSAVTNPRLPGPVEIFKQAWKIYTSRFWLLIAISFLPAVLAMGFAVFGGIFGVLLLAFGVKFFGAYSTWIIAVCVILALLVYVGFIFVSVWAQAALVCAIKGSDQNIGFKESFRLAYHKAGSFFGAGLLSVFASAGVIALCFFLVFTAPILTGAGIPWWAGVVLLPFAIAMAIFFGVKFSLSAFVVIGDDTKALSGVRRSFDYVRGYWWSVFGRFVFIFAVVYAVMISVVLLGGGVDFLSKSSASAFAGAGLGLINLALGLFLPPLMMTYGYLIYVALRNTKGESKVPADQSGLLLAISVIVICLVAMLASFYFLLLPVIHSPF